MISFLGDPDDIHMTADNLAEKAYHRLQEVEALVSEGHLCDTFVRAFVEVIFLLLPYI